MTMTMPSYQHTPPTSSIGVDEEKCPITGPVIHTRLPPATTNQYRAVAVTVLGLLLVAVAAVVVRQGGGLYKHHAESRKAVQDLMVTSSTATDNLCRPSGMAFNGKLGVHNSCTTIFGTGAPFESCWQWGGEAVYCWTKSYWDDLNQGFCPCWPIEEGLYDEWKPVDARYVNPVTTPTLSCGPPCPYQSTIPHKKTVEIRSDTQRWKQTAADSYYRTYHRLPRPTTMHAVFPQMPIIASSNAQNKKNIFVIGDIHGCYEELQTLIDTAIHQNNDGLPFAAMILVGDLGDKGPYSAQVIRWARTHSEVYAVRGNHDDGALFAALGDPKSRANKKYAWVLEGENEDTKEEAVVLSDADVTWLSELPYTLTIPGVYLQQPADIIIVHAGLIPNIPLHAQTIPTMITLRDLIPVRNTTTTTTRNRHSNIVYEMYKKKTKTDHEDHHAEGPHPQAWATTWPGPQHVIFGHDAKRGLQTQNSPLALGLDTGAVYGHALTGVLLPGRTLVSIPAQHVYCPI